MLLIFQAMDAAGKDGAIKHVMSGVNPQGCQVFSFKHRAPRNWITIFSGARPAAGARPDRHLQSLLLRGSADRARASGDSPGEGLPAEPCTRSIWHERYRSIANWSEHLHRNGTRIVKFFLHLSKEEQRKRFLERIDEPEKNWKFSLADMEERKYWKDYMKAYEECLGATSTAGALVRRSRRRQEERPAHRLAYRPRHVLWASTGVSAIERTAATRTSGDPEPPGQMNVKQSYRSDRL